MKIRYIHIIIGLVICLPNILLAQLDADFNTSYVDGCAPFLVTFINNTPHNSGNEYYWDFGNGNSSTIQSPTTSYSNSGNYNVSLTVTNGSIVQTVLKPNYIKVHQPPIVGFSPDININQCAPFDVKFQSVISDSKSYTYIWDFGDGIQSADMNPKHTYSEAGVFSVSMVVIDEYGCFSQEVHENLVHSNKPLPKFTVNEVESCNGELTVSFNNNSQGVGELMFEWNFGDEAVGNDENPVHYYGNEGIYNVDLTVTDEIGCSQSIDAANLISITNTIADFSFDNDTVCLNQEIQFTNTSVNSRRFYWDFGDGTTSNDSNPAHSYLDYGDYLIKLIIENRDCKDSIIKRIHVEEVVADFYTNKSYSCEVPVTINYINISKNAMTYQWVFGDETTSKLRNPEVIYDSTEELEKNGRVIYSDKLIVVSKYGCSSTITKSDNIIINIPSIQISDGPSSGCIPLESEFTLKDNYSNDIDNIEKINWKFKDNVVSRGASWKNTFKEEQIGQLVLEVETELGCISSVKKIISTGSKLDADFMVKDKNTFCASDAVIFTNTSVNKELITNLDWKFGDGTKSFFGVPMHSYKDTGYFDVTIVLDYNGCISEKTKEKIVYIKGPVVNFERINACNGSKDIEFLSDINDATSYTWDFGDESSILLNNPSPIHNYASTGTYKVQLSSNNSETGCSYTRIKDIKLTELEAILDTSRSAPCLNNAISFNAKNSLFYHNFIHDDLVKPFLIDYGDGSEVDFSDTITSHKYSAPGEYDVTLTIKDINGCEDIEVMPITIYKPQPKFDSDYKQGCLPVQFEFTDLSEPKDDIAKWLWNFGDGETSSIANPIHEYLGFGEYDVSLTVTDRHLCTSEMIKLNDISVIEPDAEFRAKDTTVCINTDVELYDVSLSNIDFYEWDLGDGTKSNLVKPIHKYSSAGDYPVSLKIIDDHGCVIENILSDFISVQEAPIPNFTSSVQQSDCYPFQVEFSDITLSNGIHGWNWIFGDNLNTSIVQDPKHMYTKPGKYDVTLIGSSSYGCSDTITKKEFITIGGPYANIVVKDTSCIYDNILFSLEDKQNVSKVFWDFGDGTYSREEEVTHKFNRKGLIYPSLILETNSSLNCNKVLKDTIYIDNLTARINLVDNTGIGCEPYDVSYINNSIESNEVEWKFPDQSISEIQSPVNTIHKAGNYITQLVSTSNSGCTDTTHVSLIVNPLPTITMIQDTFMCLNSNIMLWSEGGVKYNWNNTLELDDATIQNPIASPNKTTLYKLEVTDKNDCTDYDSVKVVVQQYPKVNLQDSTIIIGETIKIDISDNEIKTYKWNVNNSISCLNCSKPEFSPLQSQRYVVNLTDTADCFIMEQAFNVEVLKKYSVDVPKAFTPNNDGVNDTVYARGWGIQELIHFNIYNKWGELVYQSSDIDKGWDGKYKGSSQGTGTFSYNVSVKSLDGKIRKLTGTFQLIK